MKRAGTQRMRLLPGRFAICRLPPSSTVPPRSLEGPLVSVTRTPLEVSLVCPEEVAPAEGTVRRGWRCLGVEGPLDLSATGILASLSTSLAGAGVPIFAVSTFDTDYLLVREGDVERAVAVLEGAGHRVLAE